ncbi:MAG TPA: AraC family transcriptional regulator [Candidatus Blautia excrementipullorum]|nr:AraC family transcriptional regulator [Candidatus Blautia excrementipullorum]
MRQMGMKDYAKKERQRHGTKEFPCAGYEFLCTRQTEGTIPWHWHEELEMIYIKEGTLKLQVPFREAVMNAGDMAVINGNTLHHASADPQSQVQSFVFSSLLLCGTGTSVFAMRYLRPLMTSPAFSCVIFSGEETAAAEEFREAFSALGEEAFGYEFYVRERLSHIILETYQLLEKDLSLPESAENLDTARMEKMLTYIHEHYGESIFLRDIADVAGIGERECLRCFKRTIGESPMQYLMKYRLMQSADFLLSRPSESISDIAGECGFDYPSYYAKQFKRLYQCTPGEYRKEKTSRK